MNVRKEAQTWTGSGLCYTGHGHYYPRAVRSHEGGVTIDGRTYTPDDTAELGVRSVHIADEEETLEYMATRAARAALADAGTDAAEIDLLVLANWTDRQFIPEIAPAVAAALGAGRAVAFDVCAACVGFVHGVQTASALLTAHAGWRRAVVIAADRFAQRARPGTRGQLVFGDAAGAVVLEKGDPDDPRGLLDSVLDCDA